MNDHVFSAPVYLPGGHLQTIIPSLFRRVDVPPPERVRIDTPDGDFLDLDRYRTGSSRCVILSHGLEGSSTQPYILGMAKRLIDLGFDVVAWNFRGCSGEINHTLRFYHAGAVGDVQSVVEYAGETGDYDSIDLVGFSLGGNMTLLYAAGFLGVGHPLVRRAAAVSVPLDLADAEPIMAKLSNRGYMLRFFYNLWTKLKVKARMFPNMVDLDGYWRITRFAEFDERYTAPMHGFNSAEHYWQTCSVGNHLDDIRVPTLLLNAANDPFLPRDCYPESRGNLMSEVTPEGGHVAFFTGLGGWGTTYAEQRIGEFLDR